MLTAEGILRHAGACQLGPLSLSLAAGECLGLSGASGSGKSVLLRALAGLDALQAGRLSLQGQDVSQLSAPDYRSRVMYLPQKPVFVPGTVQANLDFPLSFGIHRRRALTEIPWQALGLDAAFATRDISRLSGGERQKLSLLRALRLAPQILLLDEPTAAMDPASCQQAESLMLNWLRQHHRACIWVSHQPDQLARLATRRLELGQGRIRSLTPPIQQNS